MKKPKLYSAFDGDAAGLRDVLIEHFRRKEDDAVLTSQTFASGSREQGVEAGKATAYRDIVHFLKKLVINNIEHPDEPTP